MIYILAIFGILFGISTSFAFGYSVELIYKMMERLPPPAASLFGFCVIGPTFGILLVLSGPSLGFLVKGLCVWLNPAFAFGELVNLVCFFGAIPILYIAYAFGQKTREHRGVTP